MDVPRDVASHLCAINDPIDRIREAQDLPHRVREVSDAIIGETVRALRSTHTLTQIAMELGVTKQRVHQMSQL